MPYGSFSDGSTAYAGALGVFSPNANVDMSGLGAGGVLKLTLSLLAPDINAQIVNLDDLGAGGRLLLTLFFGGKNATRGFADAGELWKRVPRDSSIHYNP